MQGTSSQLAIIKHAFIAWSMHHILCQFIEYSFSATDCCLLRTLVTTGQRIIKLPKKILKSFKGINNSQYENNKINIIISITYCNKNINLNI